MYVKLEDANGLFFSSCQGCGESCCDGGRFVLAPLVVDDFEDVYENFLIAFAYVDEQLRVVMLISNRKRPCIYYKDDKCSIYESRPPACVMYPFTPYYDNVFIDTACAAVGYTGFELKQKESALLKQVHPDFYHHRLENFSDKLKETATFLEAIKEDLKPVFEVEGVMLMSYSGDLESDWLKMHQASLKHLKSWC